MFDSATQLVVKQPPSATCSNGPTVFLNFKFRFDVCCAAKRPLDRINICSPAHSSCFARRTHKNTKRDEDVWQVRRFRCCHTTSQPSSRSDHRPTSRLIYSLTVSLKFHRHVFGNTREHCRHRSHPPLDSSPLSIRLYAIQPFAQKSSFELNARSRLWPSLPCARCVSEHAALYVHKAANYLRYSPPVYRYQPYA